MKASQKAVDKFTDATKRLTYDRKTWTVHMHKRSPASVDLEAATVCILRQSASASRKLEAVKPASVNFARATCFSPAAVARRVRLSDLIVASGPVTWLRGWEERPRRVFNAGAFDTVLLRRALAAVGASETFVSVEVAHIESEERDEVIPVLRVIGDSWRIVQAGIRDGKAPALRVKAKPIRVSQ